MNISVHNSGNKASLIFYEKVESGGYNFRIELTQHPNTEGTSYKDFSDNLYVHKVHTEDPGDPKAKYSQKYKEWYTSVDKACSVKNYRCVWQKRKLFLLKHKIWAYIQDNIPVHQTRNMTYENGVIIQLTSPETLLKPKDTPKSSLKKKEGDDALISALEFGGI